MNLSKLPVRELLRFGSVGIASNVVYFAALVAFRWGDLAWWLSTGLAYALSMLVNYTLQRAVTFRSRDKPQQSGPRYLVVMLSCLVINSALMESLVEHAKWHPVIGQGVAVVVTTSISYLGQKFWVFRDRVAAVSQ